MSSNITLSVLPSEFLIYPIDSKLNFLREISKDVTYNNDLRFKIISNHFHSLILQDLLQHKNQTYTRLFFMFLHNSIPFESKDQLSLFEDIFIINISLLSNIVFNIYPNDRKIQKFLLGIIFKFFFHNSIIATELLYKNNLVNFYISFSTLLPYHLDQEAMNQDKDLLEINDWIHIIYQNLLQNDNIINDNNTLLMLLLKSDYILFLELTRDIIENAKEIKVLLISINNITFLIELFISELNYLFNSIASYDNKIPIKNYIQYDKDNKLIDSNRKFLCLVDIFSVILTTEDLNNNDYVKAIQSKIQRENIYSQLISLIKFTDEIYDKVFIRNKAVKGDEAKIIPKISQSSILFCFQTNIMKILSNFAYGNEHLKAFFIARPNEFYYLLNHMKIDQCNPFKKEWCVLLIKILCEKSYQIQSMIADLKPIEMDPLLKDYIINKGTHVQMSPKNNKQNEFNFDLLTKK